LISTFVLGALIKYALDYNELSFSAACILGAILSSTDPVAVVALLKELGAPLHIETLIEMESLFNDGTSMVFFIMF
jgi:NhaP-type Na+/H+ or K+/H+ antiporter